MKPTHPEIRTFADVIPDGIEMYEMVPNPRGGTRRTNPPGTYFLSLPDSGSRIKGNHFPYGRLPEQMVEEIEPRLVAGKITSIEFVRQPETVAVFATACIGQVLIGYIDCDSME